MENKTKLPKSIKLYLSKKLKKVPTLNLNSPINPSRLMSACKYPKTLFSDKQDPDINNDTIHRAATLSDVDRFLIENFHSLHTGGTDSPSTGTSTKPHARMHDFSGNSASASSMTSSSATDDISEREAGVAVVTFSMDPYDDFRRSMKSMVEVHHAHASQPLDWDFMGELLLCYLELNDKSMHKHVFRAFSDITAMFHGCKVSAVSRRTVPVSVRRKKVLEREEVPDSPGRHFPADFRKDCDSKQNATSVD